MAFEGLGVLRHFRFVLGSTKVLRVALGKSEPEELQDNLHRVSEALAGNSGLFFTNLPDEEVGPSLPPPPLLHPFLQRLWHLAAGDREVRRV